MRFTRLGWFPLSILAAVTSGHALAQPNQGVPPTQETVVPASAPVESADLALGSESTTTAGAPTPTTTVAPPPAQPAPATPAPGTAPSNSSETMVTTRMVTRPDGLPPMVAAPALEQRTVEVELRLLPKRVPYEGESAMDGYVLTERYRWWMIFGGGALFAIGYVGAMATASEHGFHDGLGFTAIPVAGPWLALGLHDEHCEVGASGDFCRTDPDLKINLTTLGIIQTIGAVLLPVGLLSPYKVWLREDLAFTVTPAPVGIAGQGLQLNGTF
jgi:hypothetical protein